MIDKSLTKRADTTLKTAEVCELMNFFEITISDSTLNKAGNILLSQFLKYFEITRVFKMYNW